MLFAWFLYFVKEIFRARKGDLVDVLINFLLCHANSLIRDGKGFLLFIEIYSGW